MLALDILAAAVEAHQVAESAAAGDTDGTSSREDNDVDAADADDDADADAADEIARPYACGFCPKRFARSDGAKVHEKVGPHNRRRAPNPTPTPNPPMLFRCPYPWRATFLCRRPPALDTAPLDLSLFPLTDCFPCFRRTRASVPSAATCATSASAGKITWPSTSGPTASPPPPPGSSRKAAPREKNALELPAGK